MWGEEGPLHPSTGTKSPALIGLRKLPKIYGITASSQLCGDLTVKIFPPTWCRGDSHMQTALRGSYGPIPTSLLELENQENQPVTGFICSLTVQPSISLSLCLLYLCLHLPHWEMGT